MTTTSPSSVTPRPLTNDEKQILCTGCADGYSWNGITMVATVEIDTTRWNRCMMAVFHMGASDELFGLEYQDGLTECQDGWYPRDGDEDDEFVPVRVAARQVTKTVYEVVKP